VYEAIKAGRITPQPCACGRTGLPWLCDPRKRKDVVWLCRAHRAEARQRLEREQRDFFERAEAAAKAVAWRNVRSRFDAEWATISEEDRARLMDTARRDPLTKGVSESSPMFRQALIRAFGRANG
jgi:PP-loop superfamily ATP-utilizing enzyme